MLQLGVVLPQQLPHLGMVQLVKILILIIFQQLEVAAVLVKVDHLVLEALEVEELMTRMETVVMLVAIVQLKDTLAVMDKLVEVTLVVEVVVLRNLVILMVQDMVEMVQVIA